LLGFAETAKGYTPEFVQNTVVATAQSLDSYVDVTDDLLQTAVERTQDFPKLLEDIKGQLTVNQLMEILAHLKENSQQELAKYLPSSRLEDLQLQARVQEIVQMVASKPQLLKDSASSVASTLQQRLDRDADGKISVADIAGNAMTATSVVAEYCSDLLSHVVGPLPSTSDVAVLLETILNDSRVSPVLSQAKELSALLQPLWCATELLKTYVSMYATNVKDHLNPLTPYLISLISHTSVIDLPIELYRLTSNTAGFCKDADSEKVAQETRALFWALIDISFLLEAVKQSGEDAAQPKTVDGVEIIKDSDALKDGAWAKGFSQLDFS